MRRVATEIDTRRLLTQVEARQIEAALKLAGLTRRAFAERAGLGYSALTKTLSRQRVPPSNHVEALGRLLRRTRWPQRAKAKPGAE